MSERDDRRDPGYGSGASAYARLSGLDDADSGTGFFERGEDLEPVRPPRGQALDRPEDPARSSRTRTEPGRPVRGQQEPARQEPGRLARGQQEPVREPGRPSRAQHDEPRQEPGRPPREQQESARPETGRPIWGEPELARPEPGRPTWGGPEPAPPEPGRPTWGEPEPARPELGRPTWGEPELARPVPGRPTWGEPEPTRPEPGRATWGEPGPSRQEPRRPTTWGEPEPRQESARPAWGQQEPGWQEAARSGHLEEELERSAYSAEEPEAPASGRRRRRAAESEPEPAPTPERTSRAGRNVPVSIGVGILLAGVVLGTLFYAKPAFLAVLIVAAAVGSWELVRAIARGGVQPPLAPVLGSGAVMIALAWFSGLDALTLGLLIAVLATFVWRIGDGPSGYQRDMGAAAMILLYVPFLLSFGAIMARPEDGKWRILCLLVAVILSDTGGFVAGVFLGKHPMAPTISPKKSWEGFAGSLIATALGSAAMLYFLLDIAPWWGVVFGLAVSIACVLGDLAESLLKRDLGIKDMSRLLPGHGGLLDRLDSILFALPTAYVLLSVLAPTA